ncbi:MAG: flavin reductase family protein [Chloroflexi bacterium]|nr:MAG: flavin reductase family protein [Chloroflexota bacterium]
MIGFAAGDLSKDESYKLLSSAIVPRPIAWVSTLSADGGRNLAPFSFFNGMAVMPPTIVFSVGYADGNRLEKDTYNNMMATRECVVNIVTEATAEAMNKTATELPAEIDEFAFAGVTPLASVVVSPPRVQESPIQFECKLHQSVRLENELGRSDLMICSVVYIHVDDAVYAGDYKIDPQKLHVVGRLGGPHYTTTRDLFQMTRLPSQVNKQEK